jgi:hypothetical protein
MEKLVFTSVLTAAVALAGLAQAQQYSGAGHQSGGGGAVASNFGHGGFGYGYHSSTFEEGVLRGAADLTRAQGEANYFNSLSAINREEARAQALVNRQQRIAGFFRERELNRAARKAAQAKPLSPEGYAAIARKAAPDRLGAHQYDRAGGRLHWPTALTASEFAVERAALEMAFATRTPGDAGAGADFHSYVEQVTVAMQAKLQPRIGELSPMEFVAAKKFLSGLAYEAQLPLVVEGLATK